jgi:DNA-binding PadR family transcriptional regulator
MCAATPVWNLHGFTKPDPQVLLAAVAKAWESAGFFETDLNEPERVFPVLKDFVRKSLRVN